jgi:hypothetical protein
MGLMRSAMSSPPTAISKKPFTAKELRRLPPAQRDAILNAAAKQADGEYRTNRELTAFDAFGPDDLHGQSANTQTR